MGKVVSIEREATDQEVEELLATLEALKDALNK